MAEQGVRPVRTRSWFLLGLALLVGPGCTAMDDAIVAIFGRSMRDQPSVQPYQNPLNPPEGSVPFAAGNYPAAVGQFGMNQAEGSAVPVPVTPAMVLQAGNPEAIPEINQLQNPVASDAASLARGQEVYNRACVPCHGEAGAGGGSVAAAAAVLGRSIIEDESRAFTDGYLYAIIRVGRGAMPGYGHQVAHFDRWHVVNYVRQLQGALPAQAGQDAATDNAAEGDSPDA